VKLFVAFLMLMGSAGIAVIYSIVTDYIVTARLSETMQQVRVPDSGHVVVAGLGDIGIQVIRELRREGLEVVVIERQSTGSHLESIKSDTRILFGEGRDPEVLSRANLGKARALIASTGDDGTNLGIGLAARSQFPHLRVVLRIFDSDLLTALNANQVFANALSPSYLAACEFVAIAIHPGSKAGFATGKSFWTVSSESDIREYTFVRDQSNFSPG
jgi:threonine dehydrogenase-like Zn-dependent dehydrogenase